jgi:hypothetical protein
MICFYEEGKVALVSPRGDGLAGEYRWDSDGMIRMTFNSWTTIFSNTPRAARAPCARVPSFLSGVCRVRFVTPDAYPAPGHVITAPTARKRSDAAPYPAPESHSDPAAYPVPVPLGTEFRHIDEVFAVVIDGADLTLTPPSGTAQTFQRVPAD